MSFDLISSALFGLSGEMSDFTKYLVAVAKLLIAIPIPVFLGIWMAKMLRMKDYGWRLAIIFCALSIATIFVTSFPLRLGVDLKGGVILVYQIDKEALSGEDQREPSSSDVQWGRLTQRLTNRINPSGTKEIVVRQYGDWEIEIISRMSRTPRSISSSSRSARPARWTSASSPTRQITTALSAWRKIRPWTPCGGDPSS